MSGTCKTAKINFITAWAEDIIRSSYYILSHDVMKLIFGVLYVTQ